MEFELSWGHREVEDLHIATSGDATPDDLDAMVGAALADPHFRHGMTVLIDLRATRLAAMTHADVRRRAALIEARAPKVGPQCVAFVVRDMADFGILRQLQGLTEGRRTHEMGVFLDDAAARAWLADRL